VFPFPIDQLRAPGVHIQSLKHVERSTVRRTHRSAVATWSGTLECIASEWDKELKELQKKKYNQRVRKIVQVQAYQTPFEDHYNTGLSRSLLYNMLSTNTYYSASCKIPCKRNANRLETFQSFFISPTFGSPPQHAQIIVSRALGSSDKNLFKFLKQFTCSGRRK